MKNNYPIMLDSNECMDHTFFYSGDELLQLCNRITKENYFISYMQNILCVSVLAIALLICLDKSLLRTSATKLVSPGCKTINIEFK